MSPRSKKQHKSRKKQQALSGLAMEARKKMPDAAEANNIY